MTACHDGHRQSDVIIKLLEINCCNWSENPGGHLGTAPQAWRSHVLFKAARSNQVMKKSAELVRPETGTTGWPLSSVET